MNSTWVYPSVSFFSINLNTGHSLIATISNLGLRPWGHLPNKPVESGLPWSPRLLVEDWRKWWFLNWGGGTGRRGKMGRLVWPGSWGLCGGLGNHVDCSSSCFPIKIVIVVVVDYMVRISGGHWGSCESVTEMGAIGGLWINPFEKWKVWRQNVKNASSFSLFFCFLFISFSFFWERIIT